MTYSVKTIFPKEERMDDNSRKYTTTRKQEVLANTELADVVALHDGYERQGYDVGVKIKTPQEAGKDDPEVSPFEIGHQLTKSDIEYRATLKLKNSGSYEEIVALAHIIEQHGFDFTLAINLKINADSPVNIDKESTWMDSDYAAYKVTPKGSTDNIDELKAVYEDLEKHHAKPVIEIKPKQKSDEDEDFGTQLSAYPDDTEVDFTLKDSEQ